MSEIIKRLLRLERMQKAREQEAERIQIEHEPYICICPEKIFCDVWTVKFYPEGKYQRPQITTAGHDDIVIKLKEFDENMPCLFFLDFCDEWLYAFHQRKDRHTYSHDENHYERIRETDLQAFTGLVEHLNDPVFEILVKHLQQLPQMIYYTRLQDCPVYEN